MSQHLVSTTLNEKPIEIMLGWDRPLQHFYMAPLAPEDYFEDDESSEAIAFFKAFSALSVQATYADGTAKLKELVARLQVAIPAEVFIEVEKDGCQNIGNRIQRW